MSDEQHYSSPNGKGQRNRYGLLLVSLLVAGGLYFDSLGSAGLSGRASGGATGCGGETAEITAAVQQEQPTSSFGDGAVERGEPRAEDTARIAALSESLRYHVEQALSAQGHDERQGEIRSFLRLVYDLPTTQQKQEALLALRALQPEGQAQWEAVASLKGEAIEAWLDQEFLEEALAQNQGVMPEGLRSRSGTNIQGCDFWSSFQEFFGEDSAYGNFCGEEPAWNCSNSGSNMVTGYNNQLVCDDGGFDNACNKRYHAEVRRPFLGAGSLTLCQVDRDFLTSMEGASCASGIASERNACQQAKKHATCTFSVMPCLFYEHHQSIQWCSTAWGGYPCEKAAVGYRVIWPSGNPPEGGCGPSGCYKAEDS